MTKKHFIQLADTIRNSPVEFTAEHLAVLADFCVKQNPQFNRTRWLAYIANECGPNGGKVARAALKGRHGRGLVSD